MVAWVFLGILVMLALVVMTIGMSMVALGALLTRRRVPPLHIAIPVNTAFMTGLFLLIFLLLPLWFIPILGWWVAGRIVRAYMRRWKSAAVRMRIPFAWSLTQDRPPEPSPPDKTFLDELIDRSHDEAHEIIANSDDSRSSQDQQAQGF